MFNNTPISWSSKKQTIVTLSTAEAELLASSKACGTVIWLRRFYCDLGLGNKGPSTIHWDNPSAQAIAQQMSGTAKTQHSANHYFRLVTSIRNLFVKMKDCKTDDMAADELTKSLAKTKFAKFRAQLSLL
jgi:hypothetical protein